MTDALFEEWQGYRKVVDNDYMSHQRFFRCAKQQLQQRFRNPVAILDLGCGDAAPIQDLLKELNVNHYCGVDDSQEALSRAEICLSSLAVPHELCHGDLLETLQSRRERYDVIVASYSIHHMVDGETKERVLRECRRLLSPKGLMLVIDVFLSDGESRETYLKRWEHNARSTFNALNDSELTMLIEHIRSCDYPESLATYEDIGARAGFDRVASLAEDGLNRLVLLETADSRQL